MYHVLAIEDEPNILDNILEILEAEGYTAHGARNGLEGVQAAQELVPDLILCDIMMPEMDGYQVLLELRNNRSTMAIPLIFLTAKAERPSIRYGMELGADDYITKPFKPSEITSAVQARLKKQADMVEQYETRLERLRDNIIHSVPHELRTPLMGIMSCVDFLLMDEGANFSDSTQKLLQIVQRSAQRLQRLIENYLLYAQIQIISVDQERMRALQRIQISNPGAIMAYAAETKANEYDRAEDLQMELDDSPNIASSEEDLRKLTLELVDNAFKFSAAHSPVQVQSYVDGAYYQITITNQGRGMTVQQISSVAAYNQFERKLHEQQGSGLGLIIAKRLAELHGGELTIRSEPGNQTTVFVQLPVA